MNRFVILAAIVLLVAFEPIKSIEANENAENGAEPAAEPYSFSYSAESTGGFSSREESGDASGRVQGFYIIMGDDQRERRVDYVADKDGYRATISTNEIGTRSQSSADAQYQARLPSQGQLDQAKTTLEEYKFLEGQHEIELQRQLNAQRNGGQQQRQLNANQNAQSWSASGANRPQQVGQSNQASWMSSSSSGEQQQRSTLSGQANANSLRPNHFQQQAQFEQATNLTSASSTGQDEEGWRSAKLLAANQQQQQQQQQQLRPRGTTETELAASVTEATNSPFVAQTGAGFAQQTGQQQQANFQAATRQSSSSQGTSSLSAPAGTPTSGEADLGLQRQFKQQFMQQAQQLAAEDYPRQSQGQNQQTEAQRQVFVAGTTSNQQQPLEGPVAPQVPQWQQQQQQQQAQNSGSDQSLQGQEAFSQVGQQQSNIIDEVSGEQVEPNQQQIGGVGQFVRQDEAVTNSGQRDITSGQLQPVPIQPRPQPQQPQQQPYKSYEETTTTTRRPVPSGFLAIDLGRQEVELKPETLGPSYQTPRPSYQTSTLTNQRVEVDQLEGDVQQQQQQQEGGQMTDYQQPQFQVDQRQEQQPQRPKSIQQIIQSGGAKQQQQMVFVRPTIPTTQQPSTTQARAEPELTTTFRPIATSTSPRAPQVETTARTTTTSTNSQVYSSYAPSSAAPEEKLSTGFLEQTTRKPTFMRQQQQQQWVNKGTKGGIQGARRVVVGPKPTPSKPVEQPLPETPSIPTSTTREQFATTRRPNFSAQTVGTSQQAELVVSGQQTTQQVPYQSFNVKQRQSTATSERTTSTTSTTVQPAQFETSGPQEAPYQPQPQPQQQQQPAPQPQPQPQLQAQQQPQPEPKQPQLTGAVKGVSKTGGNRKQFWQQSNAGLAAASSQRTSTFQASSSVAGRNSQASVDYAPQTREYGSRIQGRPN